MMDQRETLTKEFVKKDVIQEQKKRDQYFVFLPLLILLAVFITLFSLRYMIWLAIFLDAFLIGLIVFVIVVSVSIHRNMKNENFSLVEDKVLYIENDKRASGSGPDRRVVQAIYFEKYGKVWVPESQCYLVNKGDTFWFLLLKNNKKYIIRIYSAKFYRISTP